MGQEDKSKYYQALKAAGWENTKHFREYTTAELHAEFLRLPPASAPPQIDEDEMKQRADDDDLARALAAKRAYALINAERQQQAPPVREKDPNEMAGQRLNTKAEDEPIRTDDQGRIWYQEEVQKASHAKPRGRRVLDYIDTGVEEKTVREGGAGSMTETFEVAGSGTKRAQAKITLPSYQVGQYRTRQYPFLVHCYNSLEGFDFFEVNDFWGGEAFVPQGCKRMYVENVLCYDIRTTVAEIQMEDRRLQLAAGRNIVR